MVELLAEPTQQAMSVLRAPKMTTLSRIPPSDAYESPGFPLRCATSSPKHHWNASELSHAMRHSPTKPPDPETLGLKALLNTKALPPDGGLLCGAFAIHAHDAGCEGHGAPSGSQRSLRNGIARSKRSNCASSKRWKNNGCTARISRASACCGDQAHSAKTTPLALTDDAIPRCSFCCRLHINVQCANAVGIR